MSDVVTGEAVVVEVRVAELPSRAVALFIDMLVQVTTLLGAFWLIAQFSLIADAALSGAVNILLTVLVMAGYPVAFETLSRGRSLGKLALGLRVVSDDGGPERFRQALFRGLAGVLEVWLLTGAPALITSLISAKGKRLGDIFAGTIVISERGPRDRNAPLPMPPALAGWASRLELSRLPSEVADTARQYLSRLQALSPAVQHEMGVRIAAQVASFVSPPPPPGVPAHAYLAAVLAERRRREGLRLARQAAQSPPSAYGPPQPFTPQPAYGPPSPSPRYAPPTRDASPYAPLAQPAYGPPPRPSALQDAPPRDAPQYAPPYDASHYAPPVSGGPRYAPVYGGPPPPVNAGPYVPDGVPAPPPDLPVREGAGSPYAPRDGGGVPTEEAGPTPGGFVPPA
ncbi:RDD family protein [Streptosporangium soli]